MDWFQSPNAAQLKRYVDPIFNEVWAETEYKNGLDWFGKLCHTVNPGEKTEGYFPYFGAVDNPDEFDGTVNYGSLRSALQTISDKLWTNGLLVTRRDLDDATGQLIKRKIAELTISHANFKVQRFTKFLAGGDGTSIGTTALGGAMFANSHAWGSSGTNDNLNAATGTTLSDVRVDFSAARKQLLTFKNDRGRPIHTDNTSNLVIVCGPYMSEAFNRLLNESTYIYGETNIFKGAAELWVNPYLQPAITTEMTTSTTWYLLKYDENRKPFLFQEREAPSTEMFYDQDHEHYKYKARQRMNQGYWCWTSGIQVGS